MTAAKLHGALAAALVVLAATPMGAIAVEPARSAPAQNVWAAWGGELAFIWNEDLLRDIGVRLDDAVRTKDPDYHGFIGVSIRNLGGLEFAVEKNNFDHFVGGSLSLRGGFTLKLPDGEISLVDASLRPRQGDAQTLDLVGADGKVWFYLDKLMYELVGDQLRIRTMDLRIAPALAVRLGKPFVADWEVAQLRMDLDVFRQGESASLAAPAGLPNWPGTPAPNGLKYDADVFMSSFNAQYSRCRRAGGAAGNCDGAASDDGEVVFTPSSTLRNNVNNGVAQATVGGDPLGTSNSLYTADVPWYQKFQGTFDPYRNDQHPNLIWNIYRVDSQGRIDQIGRSGVKHAFVTTNGGCLDGPISGNILSRGCSDTYGTGNNDSSTSLGPRNEIIAHGDLWARCGSIYDPDCNLAANPPGNTTYSQRLIVKESQIDPAANSGATYYFESWYIVRDDVNIYNTMAHRPATFSFNGTTGPWAIGNGTPMRLGPALSRWVDPATTNPNERSVEFATDEGHTRVAVKATDLGASGWRYDYVVMNFDFARAVTSGTPTYDDDTTAANRFRITHNFGYDKFSIALPAGVTPSSLAFSDGDTDTTNDWTATPVGSTLTWSAPVNASPLPGVPAVLNPLNWGTMYRFTVVAAGSPVATDIDVHIAETGTPQSHTASVIGPRADLPDLIFMDDFEL